MHDPVIPHHRHSIRLAAYDYSQPGAYFVTIRVHRREPSLGILVDGNVHLSEAGKVAKAIWEFLPTHFPGILLDAFVVMPDHVHGIIIITENAKNPSQDTIGRVGAMTERTVGGGAMVEETGGEGAMTDVSGDVGAIHELPLHPRTQYQRRIMLLPKIIGYFKMNTAKRINLLRLTSGSVFWQRNYWEHIIRNDAELNRIRQYIETNPVSVDLSRRDWLGLD